MTDITITTITTYTLNDAQQAKWAQKCGIPNTLGAVQRDVANFLGQAELSEQWSSVHSVLNTADLGSAVSAMDETTRDALAAALREAATAEDNEAVVDTVYSSINHEWMARSQPVGVLFRTSEYDDGYFLSGTGEILDDQGHTVDWQFPSEVEDYLTEMFGTVGPDFVVTIDLRTGILESDRNSGDLDIRKHF